MLPFTRSPPPVPAPSRPRLISVMLPRRAAVPSTGGRPPLPPRAPAADAPAPPPPPPPRAEFAGGVGPRRGRGPAGGPRPPFPRGRTPARAAAADAREGQVGLR